MKKLLIFTGLLIMALFSCKKDSYIAKFNEKPQQRAGEQIQLVKDILVGAKDGWVATTTTDLGGGYGFYMQFDAEENVVTVADLTATSQSEPLTSRYRVKQDMGTDLVFDTFTYLSMLNDPNSDVFGGALRDGFKSDIEFVYDHSSDDSIIFIGVRYRNYLKMVKATAAQKAAYMNGSFKDDVDQFKNFFLTNKNAYFDLEVGGESLKVETVVNSANSLDVGKQVSLAALFPNGNVISQSAKFAYTLGSINLLDSALTFNDITFTHFAWAGSNKLTLYDDANNAYAIKNSDVPIIPLYKLWGSKYNEMLSPFKQIFPGTSESGKEILNFFHLNMENGYTGYGFNSAYLKFVWNVVNKRLVLNGFSSQNGGQSGWTTSCSYDYTVDDQGVYSFVQHDGFSGGYVQKAMTEINDFMLNNKIKFEYYAGGDTIYVQMISVDDPTITMTFLLS